MTQPPLPSLIPRLDAPQRFVDAATSLEAAGQLAIAAGLLAEAERQFPADATLFRHRTNSSSGTGAATPASHAG
jgi:hypothetical protein